MTAETRPRAATFGAALRRTVREFREDDLTDWAATLTYYGVLSLFPALIVLTSVVGLIGDDVTQPLYDNVAELAPGPARDLVLGAVEELQQRRGSAGLAFVVGLVGGLWAASGYVAAFMRASNTVYDVEEGRPIWKTLPLRVGTTLLLLVMLASVAIGVTLTAGLARAAGDVVGVGDQAVRVWDVAKWPVILAVVVTMFAVLTWLPPNVKHPFRWLTPGAFVTIAVWLTASAAFALYVSQFGSYNKTYGALAGVIVFLVWLWLSNVALLLGVELNAELERGERIAEGQPEDVEPFLEPRDTRKAAATTTGKLSKERSTR
jgi:YihY family inner membrane protein